VLAHAEPVEQDRGQPLGLVGADAGGEARRVQRRHRRDRAGVKRGLARDALLVERQKPQVFAVHRGLASLPASLPAPLPAPLAEPREAEPQHRPAAVERGQRVGRGIQQVAVAEGAETGVGRVDQIGRGIGERPVQIEDHRAHGVHSCSRGRIVIWRKDV
jgi:hypothetical protein